MKTYGNVSLNSKQRCQISTSVQICSGAYLCVKAYGDANLTFSLRAALSLCPADFTPAGEQLLCSSSIASGDPAALRYSACQADGTCVCKPPYAKPVESVYPCESCLTH